MTEAQKRRLLRLKRAEWRWQDRERGYTTYRSGKPHVTHSSGYYAAKKKREELKNNIIAIAAAIALVLLAGIAGGVTGQ